jgi:hypothetical protein
LKKCSFIHGLMVSQISYNFIMVWLFIKDSKFYIIWSDFNLMIFNGLSNDNEITWNLKHYQFMSKRTYLQFCQGNLPKLYALKL